MNAYLKAICVPLVIALLCGLLATQAAFADSSFALGSRANVPQDEINLDTSIANMIASYSSMAGFTTYNLYGASTTANNIYIAAYGNGHFWSISFYVGHGGWDTWWHYWGWPWQWHTHTQACITADDGSYVHDCDIYDNSMYQNINSQKFVFLWSCEQGNEIGEMVTYPCGEVKARGMPLAWLHTTSLSSDGYASPDGNSQTFNGFEGVAPFLSYDGLGGVTDAGYYFLENFYYYALYRGRYYSVNAALDQAAASVWGTNFGGCILRTGYTISGSNGKMKVFGDGGKHLSNYAGSIGGCPLLYVYDGSGYAYEGLLDIHNSQGIDIVRNHTLTAVPERVNNAYLLRLVEHPLTHSYIDQVRLYAILEDNTMVQLPLISAKHSTYGNVLPQLRFDDEWKTDTAANQVIDLRFSALWPNMKVASFLFQIEGNNMIVKN
jgi:hypothetical protein